MSYLISSGFAGSIKCKVDLLYLVQVLQRPCVLCAATAPEEKLDAVHGSHNVSIQPFRGKATAPTRGSLMVS